MSISFIKVKSKSEYGVKHAYISDTHTEEYRKAYQSQWMTRLKAEIEEYHVRKDYNVGFITLTYQNSHLPIIPKKFFKDGEYSRIPCFSYNDIKKFVDTIRNYFFRKRRWRDAFRFFITSEYGEKFHRPHYHGILLYSNRISPEEMYKIVEDAWCGSSQIIPQPRKKALRRSPLGIVAPFSTFVPRDPQACGSYVAKYVCKDLAFEEEVTGKFDHLTRRARNHLRHFMPFHKQSMGFGCCLIRGKTDEELLDLYENGVQFTGHSQMVELPVYIKNKILFNNRKIYNLKSHKWETCKYYSKFLMENRDRIAWKKFRQAKCMFERFKQPGYWEKQKFSFESTFNHNDVAFQCAAMIDAAGIDDLSWFYVLYNGVPANRCYVMDSPGDQLVVRYDPIADCTGYPTLDPRWHKCCTDIISMIMSWRSPSILKVRKERSEEDELIARVRSLFNVGG